MMGRVFSHRGLSLPGKWGKGGMHDHPTVDNQLGGGLTESSSESATRIALLPNPILLMDARGMVTEVSAGAASMLGIEQKEMLQGGWLRFFKDAPVITAAISAAAQKNLTAFQFEAELRRGEKASFGFTCVTLSGMPGMFSVTVSEASGGAYIPPTYRGEYDDFLEKTRGDRSMGYWMFDLPGDTIAWSDRAFDVLDPTAPGCQDARVSHHHARSRFHADDRDKLADALTACMEKGERVDCDVRMLRQNDTVRHVVLRGEADGAGKRVFGIFEDITSQVDQEAALRQAHDRLELIQAASHYGVWDWEVGREDMFFSDRLKTMLGFNEPGNLFQVRQILDILHPEDRQAYLLQVRNCIKLGEPVSVEVRVSTSSGGPLWVEIKCALGRGADGQPLRVVGTIANITQQRKTEDELRAARADAMQASDAKSEFVATVSHELRTPLNGIIGMLDLLAQSKLPDDQQPLADTATDSARALLAILDDLLDLSKLGADRLELSPEDFSPKDLAEGVVRLFGPTADKQHVRLTYAGDASLPDAIRADKVRLRQIITNLVGNAVKFTRDGDVTVVLSAEKAENGTQLLRCRVTDTGIGIPAETQQKLFEPYAQGRIEMVSDIRGTGLGLAICKRLAERMGGEIGVDSEPDKGSCFWFTVECEEPAAAGAPLSADGADARGKTETESDTETETGMSSARSAGTPPPAASMDRASMSASDADATHASSENPKGDIAMQDQPEAGERGHLLIAEDNLVNQRVITAMVSRLGYSYDIVPDGAEAVEAARNGGYDVILMDVQMPRIDGVMATRLIREEERDDGTHVPIIAITAHAMRGTREEYLAAGMSDFIPKPISVKSLAVTLQKYAGGTAAPGGDENSTGIAAHSA